MKKIAILPNKQISNSWTILLNNIIYTFRHISVVESLKLNEMQN